MHAIAMMMTIALRFIPILIEETDKIMKAQMARGADFEDGNLIQKAKKHGAASDSVILYRRSVARTILPWPWKPAATVAERDEQR